MTNPTGGGGGQRLVVEPYLEGMPLKELRRRLDAAYEEELAREEDLGAVQAEIHDLKHAIEIEESS